VKTLTQPGSISAAELRGHHGRTCSPDVKAHNGYASF
jgi:hypothetical protein